jgi:hypothetical protein
MSQRPDRAVAGSWRLGLCGLWLSACAGRDTGSDLLSPLGVWMAIGVPRSTTLSDDVGCGVNFDEGADVEWTFICGAGGMHIVESSLDSASTDLGEMLDVVVTPFAVKHRCEPPWAVAEESVPALVELVGPYFREQGSYDPEAGLLVETYAFDDSGDPLDLGCVLDGPSRMICTLEDFDGDPPSGARWYQAPIEYRLRPSIAHLLEPLSCDLLLEAHLLSSVRL